MTKPTQRDYMRHLVSQLGLDKAKVCAAYAQAERDDKVSRIRDQNDTSPEAYADALWEDGIKKGWLDVKGS